MKWSWWYRIFLTLICGLALFGCKGKGSTGPSPVSDPPPPSPRVSSPIGYSHVLRLDGPKAQEVVDAGFTFVQVEPFNHDTITDLVKVRAAADVMRRVGGRLLLTVMNINSPRAVTWSDADFDAAVQQVIEVVGTQNVWLEAVSNGEPNYRGWQDRAKALWPGEVVFASHPCTLDHARALLSPGRWVVSDCTPILASNVSAEEIRDLTRLAIEKKAIWLWYDTFNDRPWNSAVIQEMKKEIR